jgi:hypothetical protein
MFITGDASQGSRVLAAQLKVSVSRQGQLTKAFFVKECKFSSHPSGTRNAVRITEYLLTNCLLNCHQIGPLRYLRLEKTALAAQAGASHLSSLGDPGRSLPLFGH